MNEEFVFKGEITDDVIRSWAYNENMFLCEQDEDLLLGSREYFSVLFEVAEDPDCPKGDYVLTIMDYYLMFQVLRDDNSSIPIVQEAIGHCIKSKRPKILKWMKLLEKRIQYKTGVKKVSREVAHEMGEILLNGISRNSDILLVEETENEWVVELSVPPLHRHKERLYINRDSGQFNFERDSCGNQF